MLRESDEPFDERRLLLMTSLVILATTPVTRSLLLERECEYRLRVTGAANNTPRY